MEKDELSKQLADYYSNLLIMQYRDKQKASETIKASVSCETLDGEPLIRQNDFDIETATGAALDVLGKYVGLSREVKEKVEGGSTILNDDDYRVLLKLKIIINNGRATTSEIKTGLFNTFGNDLRLFDNRDMTYTYLFRTEYNKLLGIILAEDLLPLPMGVGADIIIEVPNVDLFGYADADDGLDTSTITGYQDADEPLEDWPFLDADWILNF